MTDPDADHRVESPKSTPSRWGVKIAVAAALVVAVAAGIVVASSRDTDDETAQPPVTSGTPVTPGGPAASCVEVYDLETLAGREFAFDGTVERVEGDEVTFAVNEWFHGGSEETVTLAGAATLSGVTSAGPSADLDAGTRLLVAGDGGFAWSCGFTQPYDPEVARDWDEAFE